MNFFLIAACVAEIAMDNPNGNKAPLARSISAMFINDKIATYDLRELRNPPS